MNNKSYLTKFYPEHEWAVIQEPMRLKVEWAIDSWSMWERGITDVVSSKIQLVGEKYINLSFENQNKI